MRQSELRSRRIKLELTQAGLAARLSVSPTTVARWEQGAAAIPPYLRLALDHLALEMEEEWRNQTPEERYERSNRSNAQFSRRAKEGMEEAEN
jgi:transcriptional regulator with XRE-family HTH domain